jgi:DHA1 family bicyclomycin/chloramphenicol resistance-like MFS transporter
VGFIGCAQFTPNLMKRFKAEQLLAVAGVVQSITAAVILVLAVSGHATVPLLIGPLFLFLGCYGLVGGPSVVLALRDHAAVAGTAASLLSFLQWGSAAVGSGLAAAMADGTARPMTYVMMGGAFAALLAVRFAFGGRPSPATA